MRANAQIVDQCLIKGCIYKVWLLLHFEDWIQTWTQEVDVMATNICAIPLDFLPQNITDLPQSVIPTLIVASVLNGITALPTFFINLLVIYTILRSPTLRSCTYNMLLVFLSFTDLLVALIAQPVYIALSMCVKINCSYLCETATSFIVSSLVLCFMSLVSLAIVVLERFVSIEFPLYCYSNTKCYVAAVMACSFASAIAVGGRFLPEEYSLIRQIGFFLIIAPSVFILVFCNFKMHLTAFRQMKSIAVQQASVRRSDLQKLKNSRRIFTLGIVVTMYVVLFLSLFVMRIVSSRKGTEWLGRQFQYQTIHIWVTCLHMQSLFNPIIFSLRLSDIRKEVLKKFRFVQ